MSTAPIPHPALQVVSPPDVFLTLTIRGQDYDLSPVTDFHPSVAVRAWQLRRLPWIENAAAPAYHVRQTPQGWVECDCPDALYRRHECKHAQALAEMGLIDRQRCPQDAAVADPFDRDQDEDDCPF